MNLNWHDITFCIDRIAEAMSSSGYNPKAIIGIGRGGLIPATMLAYKLNVKNVFNFSIQSYKDDNTRSEVFTIIQEPEDGLKQFINEDVLVVDDLADSGSTYSFIKSRLVDQYGLTNTRTAAICIKILVVLEKCTLKSSEFIIYF